MAVFEEVLLRKGIEPSEKQLVRSLVELECLPCRQHNVIFI